MKTTKIRTVRSILTLFPAAVLFGITASVQADGRHGDDRYGDGGELQTLQSAEMFDIDGVDSVKPVGGGTLLRSRNAVRARLSVTGLAEGDAYSVWWVAFNRPWKCSAPGCGEDDIFNGGIPANGLNLAQIALVDISVFYADGFVTGDDGGVANVVAQLETGRLPIGADVNFGNGVRRGNGFRVELHMVVRSHGPAGKVGSQTSTFDGPCEANGVCSDDAAIVFAPVL